jgi:hypothetical protein
MTILTKNATTIRNPSPTSCDLVVDSDTSGEKIYAAVRISAPYADKDQIAIREGRGGAVWTGVLDSVVGENVFNATGFDATEPFYYGFAQENWEDPEYAPDVTGLEFFETSFEDARLVKCHEDFTVKFGWTAVNDSAGTPNVTTILIMASGSMSSRTNRVIARYLNNNFEVRVGGITVANIPWAWSASDSFECVVRVVNDLSSVWFGGNKYDFSVPDGTVGRLAVIAMPTNTGPSGFWTIDSFRFINRGLSDSEVEALP